MAADNREILRRIERQRANVMGSLFGHLAHEINNGLAGALTSAQLLLSESDRPSVEREALGDVESSVQRCAKLIRRTTDFSRLTSDLTAESVPVQQAVHDAISFLDQLSFPARKRLTISTDWPASEVFVDINRNYLVLLTAGIIVQLANYLSDATSVKIDCNVDEGFVALRQIFTLESESLVPAVEEIHQYLDLDTLRAVLKQFAGGVEIQICKPVVLVVMRFPKTIAE